MNGQDSPEFLRIGQIRINLRMVTAYMPGGPTKPNEVQIQLHGNPSPLLVRTPSPEEAARLLGVLDGRLGLPGGSPQAASSGPQGV